MTKVTLYRNKQGNIIGFCAEGHSDDASEYGQDIYCAAISAICQTAALGLTEYIKADVKLNIKDGYMLCEFKKKNLADQESSRAVLETMRLGLTSFKEEYPDYLELIEEVR